MSHLITINIECCAPLKNARISQSIDTNFKIRARVLSTRIPRRDRIAACCTLSLGVNAAVNPHEVARLPWALGHLFPVIGRYKWQFPCAESASWRHILAIPPSYQYFTRSVPLSLFFFLKKLAGREKSLFFQRKWREHHWFPPNTFIFYMLIHVNNVIYYRGSPVRLWRHHLVNRSRANVGLSLLFIYYFYKNDSWLPVSEPINLKRISSAYASRRLIWAQTNHEH